MYIAGGFGVVTAIRSQPLVHVRSPHVPTQTSTGSYFHSLPRSDRKLCLFFPKGQQAELGAGEVGGGGGEAHEQGDEISCLLLDISPLASKW